MVRAASLPNEFAEAAAGSVVIAVAISYGLGSSNPLLNTAVLAVALTARWAYTRLVIEGQLMFAAMNAVFVALRIADGNYVLALLHIASGFYNVRIYLLWERSLGSGTRLAEG